MMRALALALALAVAAAGPARGQDTTAAPRGRITGRVVDAATGQPLPSVQVQVVDRSLGALTDLDGRYAITALPAGVYSVRARRIGFQARQVDSVVVRGSQPVVVDFVLRTAPVALEGVVVREERVDQAAREASLLAIQQRAPAASDGISAEQIRRTPDSDAGDAATRVSGVSVVDDKFVVVRGLSERYSNTLVNGVEVASPEPAKKIVPLDMFPASLLESIVVSKSATPDKPGDFAGGSVEVRTAEFPDRTVTQVSVSQAYNSQTTLRALPMPSRTRLDWLGFDEGRRTPPALPPDSAFGNPFAVERFAEGIRHDWAPRFARTMPNLGFALSLGGQVPSKRTTLGYVTSLTYSASSEHSPDRFFQFIADPSSDPIRGFVYQDYRNVVDWGGVANVAWRLGTATKLTWKNLYTRTAEELYSTNEGFNADRNGDIRSYQFQYVERDLLQSQLAGDHLVPCLASSRFEWKATLSRSTRDEPDNRQVTYIRPPTGDAFTLGTNNDVWFRYLTDNHFAGQVDLSIPVRVRRERDLTVKLGSLFRAKRRAFDANLFSFNSRRATDLPDGLLALPPERLFTPEIIGSYLVLDAPGTVAQPYDADDDLVAAYIMLDASVIPRVRLVGGARLEDWRLDLFDGGRDRYADDPTLQPLARRNRDLLWSGNVTISLTERMNLRLAGFKSVTRPDTRELSPDTYVAIVGSCPEVGNPNLQRATITNADVRWEWYPRPGEVLSISAFHKEFDRPIIRAVTGDNNCTFTYQNATTARNSGIELDVRQHLTYLPSWLSRLSAAVNFTYVWSRVRIDPAFGVYDPDLPLEGQSPYTANGTLSYTGPRGGFSATVLYNLFDDRVVRYGFRSAGGATATQGPNIVERGRRTLDAKVQKLLGRGLTLSLAGRNLTNTSVTFIQKTADGDVATGFAKAGVTVQLGLGYAR